MTMNIIRAQHLQCVFSCIGQSYSATLVLTLKFISWKPPIPAHFHMPYSTRLPDIPCSPHGGEPSWVSWPRASPAAEVTNNLGELPWRLEGREYYEGMLDLLPDLPPSGEIKKTPTLHGTGDACNRAFKQWNKLPGSHQAHFGGLSDAQNLVGGGRRCPIQSLPLLKVTSMMQFASTGVKGLTVNMCIFSFACLGGWYCRTGNIHGRKICVTC